MSKDTGGPAFHIKVSVKDGGFDFDGIQYDKATEIPYSGMTLRDYFAAKVIQSLCHPQILSECFDEETVDLVIMNDTGLAYKIADAMLKARGEND